MKIRIVGGDFWIGLNVIFLLQIVTNHHNLVNYTYIHINTEKVSPYLSKPHTLIV
jgi:hypothetical protein